MMKPPLLLFSLLAASLAAYGSSFVQPNVIKNHHFAGTKSREMGAVQSTPLTFRMANRDDDKEVNVNLVDDVDAFTLTAVGFGLIAFNFLVLANVSAY